MVTHNPLFLLHYARVVRYKALESHSACTQSCRLKPREWNQNKILPVELYPFPKGLFVCCSLSLLSNKRSDLPVM